MTSKDAAALYRRAGFEPPPDLGGDVISKFLSQKKVVDNITFDSTLEAEVYRLLKIYERAGAISNLELQPVFLLKEGFRDGKKWRRRITYRADFRFRRGEQDVVIDAKGIRTQVFMLKMKLFRARYPDIVFEQWTRETLKTAL
jgi:hypothetical protein